MMRCLLATVGKDAPGSNAALRASTRLALRKGMEVIGAKGGFVGILEGRYHKMKESDVGFILGRGGSVLGSTEFHVEPGDSSKLAQMAERVRKFDLFVAIGGLGTFAFLDRLYTEHDMGLTTTMFVPASVENEFLDPVNAPSHDGVHAEAIGSDTAANTAIEAIDRLREQSHLSRTVFLVECLGLKSNFLPIQIGAATGAHRIYLPRYPRLTDEARLESRRLFGSDFDPNRVDVRELVSWIESTFESSTRPYLLIIIPNGIPLIRPLTQKSDQDTRDYESIITSMAPLELTVLRLFDDMSIHFAGHSSIQIRYVIIDDLQLGGRPTARDRLLGSMYGEAAIEEFLSIVNAQQVDHRGNLNLLAIDGTSAVRWRCFARQEVTTIFRGDSPRGGGLDPIPFFRQMRGTVSGYRPWANL